MSNYDNDLLDLDPTEADLLAAEADEDDNYDLFADEDDLDLDGNYEDDRYTVSKNGMPSWSIYGSL